MPNNRSLKKIDAFTHILPTKYIKPLLESMPSNLSAEALKNPMLSDLEGRFKIMDGFEGLAQVISLPPPPVESITNSAKALDLAKLANDEMAELVLKYPDRFVAAIACLPMNDIDAALTEADRAIRALSFKGVVIHTPINDKPLDSAEFLPLYEKMNQFDLPIFLHPFRNKGTSNYGTDSEYLVYHIFGWPYETSAAMTRLVFSGILAKYPKLKVVCHHNGAMIPFFESRIKDQQYRPQMDRPAYEELDKPPLDYFRMFYVDTVTRTVPALTCTYHFFGAKHMVFGTDMPFGIKFGEQSIQEGVDGIEKMDIPSKQKQGIFCENISELLNLAS